MTRDGHSFERKAILKWISQYNTLPFTMEPLTMSQLVRDHALKLEIKCWRQMHQESGSATETESECLSDFNDNHEEDEDPTLMYLPPEMERQMRYQHTNSQAKDEHEDVSESEAAELSDETRPRQCRRSNSSWNGNKSSNSERQHHQGRFVCIRQCFFGTPRGRPSASHDS